MKGHAAWKFLVFILAALIVSALFIASFKTANAHEPLPTIIILQDGSVFPADAPIKQFGNTYSLTNDVYAGIKIQKSNVVLDGAGYTISGPYNGTAMGSWVIGEGPDQAANGTAAQYPIGVDLAGKNVQGVTVMNLCIQNFSIGMYIWTTNNSLLWNKISDNIVGVLLSGSNQTVTKNIFANNQQGLFFGFNSQEGNIPTDILISQNAFENNVVQLSGCGCKNPNATEPPHNWDNGSKGNYWSNYNGTDTNQDGVGDTAYVIDILNRDRYPLMQNPALLQIAPPNFQPQLLGIAMGLVALVLAAFAFGIFLRKRKM